MSRIDQHIREEFIINEAQRTIVVLQRWRYIWNTQGDVPMWTYQQRRNFMREAERVIRSIWSRRCIVRVRNSGGNQNQRYEPYRDFRMFFDIDQDTSDPNWEVYVTKVSQDSLIFPSHVDWDRQQIGLSSRDIRLSRVGIENGHAFRQYVVAHEFGHTIGNAGPFNEYEGDEHNSDSTYIEDRASVMNWGNRPRRRHYQYLVSQLNDRFPQFDFEILTVHQ